MQFDPRIALDRAIDRIPHSRERDRITEALIDDGYDDGSFPKYDHIKTVGDVLRAGVDGLIAVGLSRAEADWLLGQFGVAASEICPRCAGEQWVCENHQGRPWGGGADCPCGGAGAPCPDCNAMAAPLKPPPEKRKGGWPKGRKRKANAGPVQPEA